MARVTALIRTPRIAAELGILRSAIVCGCALALIVAGQALPF